MTTLEDAFGGKNLDEVVSMFTDGIMGCQEKKQQEAKKLEKTKNQQAEKRKKRDGTITPRPGYADDIDISKLVFNLSNHTIGDVWCLPNNRRRADDILRHSKYTYLDAVVASVISCALEGDMTAAKLVLSFVQDYTEPEEKTS